MKKFLFVIVAAALSLASCTAAQSPAETSASDKPAETSEKVEIINNSPAEFEANMTGEYLLLDVRTQEEYDQGHIDGSVLIPVSDLQERIDEISQYKDQKVLVYCRSGNRSVTASYMLIDNGFTQVYNLETGFNGWSTYKGQ